MVLRLHRVVAPAAARACCCCAHPIHAPHPQGFPRIKLLTSEIDEGIDEYFRVVPGVGEFGDRYFTD